MKKLLATSALLAMGASAAQAVQARYFFATAGLTNAADTESPAVAAGVLTPLLAAGDPSIDTTSQGTTHRLWLWAMIPGSPTTDLKGFNLAFRSTGDVQIVGTNIWQNTASIPDPEGGPDPVEVYRRWEDGGWPGAQSWNAQLADPTPTVSVLTDGITNNTNRLDDQRRTVTFGGVSQRAVVVGYVDVAGTAGDVHIVNQASGFLQIDPNNRIFLGLDDSVGELAEIVGVSYDNASPEATLVPEPASLSLLALAVLGLRRR